MAGETTVIEERKSLVPTNADMLLEINNAIYKILVGGQSYTIGSRKLTRADLSQLYKMRQEIESLINAEENQSSLFDDCYVAFWPDTR